VKYKALIIGLGQIGMGYDYTQRLGSQRLILSHAQALAAHTKFEIEGGVDSNLDRRDKFRKKFKKPSYETLNEALETGSFDLVVIATSTKSHYQIFKDVLDQAKPKLIVLEKPLAYTATESLAMLKLSLKAGVPVAVNYFRAYEPAYQLLRSQLQEGLLGFPLTAIVRYSNGMMNNGSHWLQFVLPILGELQGVRFGNIQSTFEGDFTGDIHLSFKRGTTHFIPFMHVDYYLFEIDIYGPLGKVMIDSSGNSIKKYFAEADPAFPNERSLTSSPEITEPCMSQYQRFIYDNVQVFLEDGDALSCSLESLRDMVEVFFEIEKQLRGVKYVD
jgi:predicted dehydrogenase